MLKAMLVPPSCQLALPSDLPEPSRGWLASGEVALRQIDELEKEILHLGSLLTNRVGEIVETDERRDCRCQAGGSVDQRLGNSWCDRSQRGRARDAWQPRR